jgi:EpsI family protein
MVRVPAHRSFMDLAETFHGWHASEGVLDDTTLSTLRLTDYWYANYDRERSEPPVNFYVAYYEAQGIGTSIHSPDNCIPGGGWQVLSKSIETIALADGRRLSFTRMKIQKDDAVEIVYYWFDERGRNLTEQFEAKFYLLIDSFLMHRTDGALIRVMTALKAGEQDASADERLAEFVVGIYPKVKAVLPGIN